ncbi:MAG: CBS domain-containing protein [Acidobacteriota bacterium]
MIIITTHLNADFDCIGAMIGVRKIYPEAEIVFPGSKEPAVRDFLKSGYFHLQEMKLKLLDPSSVRKVILVDTQNIERLGSLTDFIRHKHNLDLEFIDHHPDAGLADKRGMKHILPVGSTTTIVTKMLRDKKIPIEPKEATLMAIGIYEDTGFLLFPTTTPEDLTAVGFLLGCGADLRVVSSALKRGLSSEQIILYNDLITSSRTFHIKGEDVTISMVRKERYIPDAALVVHQYCASENIVHFYTLIEMEDRIFLIGRSKIPSLNAGKVAEAFGGGGHASASSATIKDMTLVEARDRLLGVIERLLSPAIRAGDIMSKVVFSAPSSIAIEKALEFMNRSRVNAFPLTEKGRVVGAVTRQMIDTAIYHGMGKTTVREIMLDTLEILPEEADLSEVQKVMIEKNLRFVLIGKSPDDVRGIITRMALFRNLYEEQVKKGKLPSRGEGGVFTEDLRPMMDKRLPKKVSRILKVAGETADKSALDVYLVGGIVRDLILDEENIDIDLVVEGNGIKYARQLAKALKGRARATAKFQTAVVIIDNHLKIDIASARTEYYEYPAALPTIERGMIRQDLYRRDFTINALAIKINRREYGMLVDYFGGRRDLREGMIRVIHSLSFIEDPTRAYRAIRFATRLGFELAKETQHLIEVASRKGIFERLSGRRITKELQLLFDDEHPVKAVRMMDSFHLLDFISREIKLTKSLIAFLERIEEVLSWYRLLYRGEKPENWLIYLMALADSIDEEGRIKIAQRLSLNSKHREVLVGYKERIHQLMLSIRKKESIRTSDIFSSVRNLPLEIILFVIARTERIELKKSLTKFLLHFRNLDLEIDGNDLKALGLLPGPEYSRIFNLVLLAKVDGKVKSRRDELALAKHLIKKSQKT